MQSQPESDFARRMYVYNYRLFDRYNRQVVSLAVLGDDRPTWRLHRFEYSLWGCTAGIQFPVAKLLDFAAHEAALEANTNPFAVLTLAHLKTQETQHDPTARRTWKSRLVRRLYERGWSAEDVRQLFHFIDWMMDLPQQLEVDFRQEIQRYEQEQGMPHVFTIESMAREEGLVKGREEGQVKGLLRGIEMGLKVKFEDAGLELMPTIRQQARLELLEALIQALETGASVEDLRRLVEPGQG